MVTNTPPISIKQTSDTSQSPKSPFKPMPDVRNIAGKGVLVIEQKSEVTVPEGGVNKPEVPHATCFQLVNHDSRLTLSDDSYVQLVMGAGLRIKVKQKQINKKVQDWMERINLEEKIEDGMHSYFQCGNMMFEIESHGATIEEIDMGTIMGAKRTPKAKITGYLQSTGDTWSEPKTLLPKDVVHFKLTN